MEAIRLVRSGRRVVVDDLAGQVASWRQEESGRGAGAGIGGVDRRFVSDVVKHLQVHVIDGNAISDKLYISKAAAGEYGPAMAIVGP